MQLYCFRTFPNVVDDDDATLLSQNVLKHCENNDVILLFCNVLKYRRQNDAILLF